jgi:hypothetical protein
MGTTKIPARMALGIAACAMMLTGCTGETDTAPTPATKPATTPIVFDADTALAAYTSAVDSGDAAAVCDLFTPDFRVAGIQRNIANGDVPADATCEDGVKIGLESQTTGLAVNTIEATRIIEGDGGGDTHVVETALPDQTPYITFTWANVDGGWLIDDMAVPNVEVDGPPEGSPAVKWSEVWCSAKTQTDTDTVVSMLGEPTKRIKFGKHETQMQWAADDYQFDVTVDDRNGTVLYTGASGPYELGALGC